MVGGGEHSFLDLLSHLPAAWKPVAIVPHEGELNARLRGNRIETHVIPLPAIRPWLVYHILSCLGRCFIVCRKYRPALIYANGSRAAFYGGLVGRLLGLPVIWHCRVAAPDFYFDRMLQFLCTRIVVNSSATGKRFGPRDRSDIQVIYNGLDLSWLKDGTVPRANLAGEDWKVLLVVGRVSKWKRHDLALAAFEEIARFDPKVHLVCLGAKDQGEQKWWDKLQEQTRNSTFSDRVHWIGQVEDVRPWLKTASILILPSENEPFGRVLVEAMACGVPVVATRGGGVPEIVREGRDGLLVATGKTGEIASAVKTILNDESLRDRIGQAAIKRAEFFSLDKHVAGMTRLFEETVGLKPDE